MSNRVCPSGWLQGFREYSAQCEAPEPYLLYTAFAMLAGAMRRHVYLTWEPWRIYPNMYVVLVGPPGLGKGNAIGYGRRLLRHVHGANIGANKTSPEALITMLAGGTLDTTPKQRPKNDEERKKLKAEREAKLLTLESTGTLIADEFSVLVGRDAQKNGLLSILANWYDCPDEWKNQTVSTGRGIEVLRNVALTIVGGTTPDVMSLSFPTEAIGGGLSSRILYVSQSARRFYNPFPEWTKERELEVMLIEDLKRISELRGEAKFGASARAWFDTWYRSFDRRAMDDRFWGYLERKPVHLLKLALMLSASQSDDLTISVRHMEVALALLNKIEVRMPESFNALGPTGKDIDKIALQLVAHDGLMSFQELMRLNYRSISKQDMNLLLQTMVSASLIEDKIVGAGDANRVIRAKILTGKNGATKKPEEA